MKILFKHFKSLILFRLIVCAVFLFCLLGACLASMGFMRNIFGNRYYIFGTDVSIVFNLAFAWIGLSLSYWLVKFFEQYILYFIKCAAVVNIANKKTLTLGDSLKKASEKIGGVSLMFGLDLLLNKCCKELSKRIEDVPALKMLSKIPFLSSITYNTVKYMDECVFYYIYVSNSKVFKGAFVGILEYVQSLPAISVSILGSVVKRTLLPWITYILIFVSWYILRYPFINVIYLFIAVWTLVFLFDQLIWDLYICVRCIHVFEKSYRARKEKKAQRRIEKSYASEDEENDEDENSESKASRKGSLEDYIDFDESDFIKEGGKIYAVFKNKKYNMSRLPSLKKCLDAVPSLADILNKYQGGS